MEPNPTGSLHWKDPWKWQWFKLYEMQQACDWIYHLCVHTVCLYLYLIYIIWYNMYNIQSYISYTQHIICKYDKYARSSFKRLPEPKPKLNSLKLQRSSQPNSLAKHLQCRWKITGSAQHIISLCAACYKSLAAMGVYLEDLEGHNPQYPTIKATKKGVEWCRVSVSYATDYRWLSAISHGWSVSRDGWKCYITLDNPLIDCTSAAFQFAYHWCSLCIMDSHPGIITATNTWLLETSWNILKPSIRKLL